MTKYQVNKTKQSKTNQLSPNKWTRRYKVQEIYGNFKVGDRKTSGVGEYFLFIRVGERKASEVGELFLKLLSNTLTLSY